MNIFEYLSRYLYGGKELVILGQKTEIIRDFKYYNQQLLSMNSLSYKSTQNLENLTSKELHEKTQLISKIHNIERNLRLN